MATTYQGWTCDTIATRTYDTAGQRVVVAVNRYQSPGGTVSWVTNTTRSCAARRGATFRTKHEALAHFATL